MKHIAFKLWLLVAFSAAMQVVIFPVAGPLPAWRGAIAWIAFIPMLIALLDQRLRIRDAALLGYICGFLWYLGTCYWIYSTMHIYGGLSVAMGVVVMVLFCLYLGLYHLLFAVIVSFLRKYVSQTWTLFLIPFVWIAVELARARVTGFPWNLLGYSQIESHWSLLLAPIGGVMLVSFLLMCGNVLLTDVWFVLSSPASPQGRKIAAALAVPVIAVIALFGVKAYHSDFLLKDGRSLAVMYQPNLDVGSEAHGPQSNPMQQAMQLTLTDQPRTITLWPESPAMLAADDGLTRQQWSLLASKTNAPVIAGSFGMELTFKGRKLFNSAALIDPESGFIGRYDKIHLVPFGEYVPFESIFSFASGLTEAVGNFQRGQERTVFHTGGHAYGVFICYESIFGDEVREFARDGAQVLVNISDDGWYGDTSAPFQHINMARMRAIENNRWVLRDTNNGITGSIDPFGRVHDTIPRHTEGVAVAHFGFNDELTFYTRHGDWFAWLCALITLAACGYAQTCKMKSC